VVIEEQKRICDSAFPYVPGSVNIPHFLLESATHEQLLEWMPPIVRGEKIVSVAITEPDAGSDVKTLRTSARSEGDHYVINGSKIFITLGHVSDWCMVAARTGGEGPKGISLIMVDTRHTPGFKVGRILDKVGQHGLDTCELFFEDMRVPKSNLIGGVEGTGFGQLMNVFVRERLAIATTGVAVAESAVRLAIDYAKQRKMFGKTLWDFQNTRFKMVECETQTRFARCVLDSLIDRASMGQHVDPNEAARAKWYCSDLECRVVDECVQLLGGYGYMDEYPIAQLYMDARVERIYGGSNETLKELIARSL
jgi:acyl-CoA dehydrogenase